MFLFIFLLPAAQAILFCLAIGRDPTFLKMAVVNEELDASQGRVCNYTTGCVYSMFSCRYLRFIDNSTIVQVRSFLFAIFKCSSRSSFKKNRSRIRTWRTRYQRLGAAKSGE